LWKTAKNDFLNEVVNKTKAIGAP